MKIALITGVTGQDGSYLSELLLSKGYKVIGLKRRTSIISTSRIDHLLNHKRFHLEYFDLLDISSIIFIIKKYKPHEIYNLAAQSHVKVSFENPIYTSQTNSLGTLNMLEAIKITNKKIRFYQASTSELYGTNNKKKFNEKSLFLPASPYGVSKIFSYWITVNYRESYNMFCSNGILFNHESPRRGETFVTSKVCKGAVLYKKESKTLYVGNLYAYRDWGHAKDYVNSMWLILNHKNPDDFVIATGKSYTVKQLINTAFKILGINIVWKGHGINEVGIDSSSGKIAIRINQKYFRPTEVPFLKGDPTKAKKILKWKTEISFYDLIEEMVNFELKKYG